MESAVVDDDNDPSDTNNNSTTHTSVGDCINNTILATGVFTSAELYRLARAPITSQSTVGQQRPHHSHHHHPGLGTTIHPPSQPPSSQMLGHQLQVVKLEQEASQGQYCGNNGTVVSRTNGFSPDSHSHHASHQMIGSPIPMTQSSMTGAASSSASSSPSYAVGLNDLPPHKRLRRMQASEAGEVEVHEVRGHQMQLHHHHQQQPLYNWSDGHSDSEVSLIKSESPSVGSGGLYTHVHVGENPLSPHSTLYHHMQQPHLPSTPHHHHIHPQHHHHHHQQHQSQQQVLKYQENGDTLSDFVNLVSALSCPSDGHFWSDQTGPQHQSSSHTGSSDPSDEVEDSKSLREDQQEEEDLRDEQVVSHQLQVMSQYHSHLPGMQPPPPTARPVMTPVLESRWNGIPSPPTAGPSAGYLLPEKDVSLGYFRPAFFVSQGLNDPPPQIMLMAQQQHQQQQQVHQQQAQTQRELSSPVSRSNVKGSPSPPKSPS